MKKITYKKSEVNNALRKKLHLLELQVILCSFLFKAVPIANIIIFFAASFHYIPYKIFFIVLGGSILLYCVCHVLIINCCSLIKKLDYIKKILGKSDFNKDSNLATIIIESDKSNKDFEDELNNILGVTSFKIQDIIEKQDNRLENDIKRFQHMFKLHNPEKQILDFSKDELIDFASTHGFTINYSADNLIKLIDNVIA